MKKFVPFYVEDVNLSELEPLLSAACLPEIHKTQQLVRGFLPFHNESYLHMIGDSVGVAVYCELEKKLSAKAISAEIEKRLDGKEASLELRLMIKEDIVLEQIEAALPVASKTIVVIDSCRGLMLIGASSYSKADPAIGALREAIGSLKAKMTYENDFSHQLTMIAKGEARISNFNVGYNFDLFSIDGEKASFKGVEVDSESIEKCLANAYKVKKIDLVDAEGCRFTIDNTLRFSKFSPPILEEEFNSEIEAQGADLLLTLDCVDCFIKDIKEL